jgi:hypothetical protein
VWRSTRSARRHGIADEDIVHAVEDALAPDSEDEALFLGSPMPATP